MFMHDMKKIEKCFSARGDLLEYIIMDIILQYNDVVGSWTLKMSLIYLKSMLGQQPLAECLKYWTIKDLRFRCPIKEGL